MITLLVFGTLGFLNGFILVKAVDNGNSSAVTQEEVDEDND